MNMNFIEKFLNSRKQLIKNYKETWGKIKVDREKQTIEFPSPELLTGFAGFLKYQLNGRVYFRGEKDYFKTTIPSLFRSTGKPMTNEIISVRKKAFDLLVEETPKFFNVGRFTDYNIRPLLQHYGIKSDWLDMLDNIFVALWFSFLDNENDYSYIKFFTDRINSNYPKTNDDFLVVDLRNKYSSLSLRLHCQHGLSATKKINWEVSNIDFNSNLIAIAKVPNIREMKLSGEIFNKKYMFPNKELDNTYKLLSDSDFQEKVKKICDDLDLDEDTLGEITQYY